MRNSKSKLQRMATPGVWASLVVCACLLAGGASAFAQEPTDTTVPDDTYGAGGTKHTGTWKSDDASYTALQIKDGKGIEREFHYTEVSRLTGAFTAETHSYWDCEGNLTYEKQVVYDTLGNEFFLDERTFKDGKQIQGFQRTTDKDGKKTSKGYDNKTGKYQVVSEIAFETGREEISTPPRDTTICNVCKPNYFIGEGQLIREDAQPDRFNTYGLTVDYTRFLGSSCRVGLTGDFNADWRTRNDADLTKTSFLGGITVIPFKGATTTDKVTVSTHALFGISHFNSTAGSVSSTDNAFTMKLGGAVDVNVTNNFFVRPIQIDYAPTFFGTTTQNNVQIGFGAGFRFGHK
jgi:hypothetical protein